MSGEAAFTREQWVARDRSRVFAFFADVRNLERITPPFLRFRVLGADTPEVRAGTRIDYRLSLHGLPLRWQSRIETWDPDRCFVDAQTRGPYKLWHHTHEFEDLDGGTLVRDRVRYQLPFGVLGNVAAGRFVARDLKRIFDFRRNRIGEIFATADSDAAAPAAEMSA